MLATEFDRIFAQSKSEADEFYSTIIPPSADEDTRNIMRQALAGALWSKQYYHYVVRDWIDGDSATPVPPEPRQQGRNSTWKHIYNADISPCPTNGSFPGMRPGTWRSTASLCRWLIPTLPKSN